MASVAASDSEAPSDALDSAVDPVFESAVALVGPPMMMEVQTQFAKALSSLPRSTRVWIVV